MRNPKLQLTQRISQADARLTAGDRKVADYLLRTYPVGLLENASAIAHATGLNVSTVSRFFPKIGYRSIRTAHQEFREGLEFLMASPLSRGREQPRPATDDRALFHDVQRLDLKNIQETFKDISFADVRKLMRFLLDRSRGVYLFGSRKHYSLCYYAFIQLNGIRENVFLAPTDNFFVADLLARLRAQDILWLFDFRRYPRLSGKVAEYCDQAGAPVVLFTDSPMAPLSRFAGMTFTVATRGVSWFDSYTAGVSLINALLAEYVRQAGDSARERYAIRERLFRHFEIFTGYDALPAEREGRPLRALVPRRTGRMVLDAGGVSWGNRAANHRPIGNHRKEES
jgi:DNA-binding MurR/RpiR family transcriptional regulator